MIEESSLCSTRAKKPSFESKWDEIFGICFCKARHWTTIPRHLEAQDLAVIAAEKVWLAFDEYDGIRPLRAFVNKIAFNAFVDTCRSHNTSMESKLDETRKASPNEPRQETLLNGKVVTSIVDSDEDVENRPAYSLESESSSIALGLEPLLSCLPARQRQVIEMSFGIGKNLCEWPDECIAEKLGVTRQTVISDKKKALLDMQTRVGRIGIWAA